VLVHFGSRARPMEREIPSTSLCDRRA